MLSLMESELVARRRWFSHDEFSKGVSIGTMTPGPISVASAVFYGYRLCGVTGSLMAVVGILLPAFVLILVFSASFTHFEGSWVVSGLSKGVGAAAVGILLGVVVRTGRSFVTDVGGGLLAVAAFLVMSLLRLNPIYVIVLYGMLGLVLPVGRGRRRCRGSSS